METYMSPGAVTEILYLLEVWRIHESKWRGGVAHEQENIDVMKMSYDLCDDW
jgi:hypothetical protein